MGVGKRQIERTRQRGAVFGLTGALCPTYESWKRTQVSCLFPFLFYEQICLNFVEKCVLHLVLFHTCDGKQWLPYFINSRGKTLYGGLKYFRLLVSLPKWNSALVFSICFQTEEILCTKLHSKNIKLLRIQKCQT